jgi:hypothetical protein
LRSSSLLALALGLAAAPLALAQEPPPPAPPHAAGDAELERLEAENAVLRLELKTLLERLGRLEERARQWPDSGARAPARTFSITETGDDLHLPDVRLGDDAGAVTPEDLARTLHAELAALPADGQDELLRELVARLACFAPDGAHPFLVPQAAWARARQGDEPEVPVEDDLLAQLRALGPALHASRLLGVQSVAAERPTRPARHAGPAADAPPVSSAIVELGVKLGPPRQDIVAAAGVVAADVLAGSLAQQGGLQAGDTVQSLIIDGRPHAFQSADELERILASTPRGVPLRIGYARYDMYYGWRPKQSDELTLDLPGYPRPEPDAAQAPTPAAPPVAPAARLALSLDGPLGPARLDLTCVRVNGRWLLAAARTSFFEERAAAVVAMINTFARAGGDPLGDDGALLTDLRARGVPVEALGKDRLGLPFYRVDLVALPDHEYGVRAVPLAGPYATFVTGPLPGEHDPLAYPYRVRRVGR